MRARKTDSTQKKGVKDLRDAGYLVYIIGGTIDTVVYAPLRDEMWLLDWKSEDGKLTDSQQKLVDAGWPILFPKSSEEALEMLKPKEIHAGYLYAAGGGF